MNAWPWIGLGGLLLFWNKLQAAGMIQINDITAQLPKGVGSYGSRPLDAIDLIILHHSATSSGDPWTYAKYHIENHGWPGIGYHFVIQPDGTIYQTNKLTTISYQATGANNHSIGICLTGNFNVNTPPLAQHNALIGLLRNLETLIGQKPIIGHKEVKSTSCPGDLLDVAAIEAEAWGNQNIV